MGFVEFWEAAAETVRFHISDNNNTNKGNNKEMLNITSY